MHMSLTVRSTHTVAIVYVIVAGSKKRVLRRFQDNATGTIMVWMVVFLVHRPKAS